MEVSKVVSRAGTGLRVLLAASAAIALVPVAASAQQTQPPAEGQIGPPQLRDFQLEPRQRIVTQPRPAPQPPATPPEPAAERPAAQQEQPAQNRTRSEPARQLPPAPRAPVPTPAPSPTSTRDATPAPAQPTAPTAPTQTAPAPVPGSFAAPAPQAETPAPAPAPGASAETPAPSDGPPWLLILLGGLGVGLAGYAFLARRRAAERRALALETPMVAAAAAPQPQAPRVPRPDPVPRPWLEIELTPERTTADPAESIVEFELRVHNKGGSTAQGIRLQAKLICSTPEQDKEIAAFHRKKPGEHRTLDIPDIGAGQELRLKGQVDIKREHIKALKVEDRLLFVPLVAVNAFYEWGSGRSGQTSKSFLVGREQADAGDKMAPFRLDIGPRVYRTVGQRPYKVERRV